MSIGIVDAMIEKGDIDGRAVWLRIVKAAEELLDATAPPNPLWH